MSPNAFSPALLAATIFLTRPLILLGAHSPTTLASLQAFLQSALSNGNGIQLLSFTPTTLPPLPLQLACVAFGIKWTDWMQAFGGAAFDLVVEPTRVYVVKKSTGQVGIIWISKNSDAGAFASPPAVITREADADLELESDASDIEFECSRPSSRSSTFSDSYSDSAFSFSSRSSHSSKSSISSLSSHSKTHITKPPPKPQSTKYLYQGGVSTVLTGGVMLGAGAASSTSTTARPAFAPAPVAPVYTPPHRAHAHAQVQIRTPARSGVVATTPIDGSWRRAPLRVRVSA